MASVWSSDPLGSIIINCCQAKPLSNLMLSDFTAVGDTSLHSFMFTFPNKGDTLDFLSLFLFFLFFCFKKICPDNVSTREADGPRPISLSLWEQMNVIANNNNNNNNLLNPVISFFLFLKNPKKDAKMWWMYDWKKVSLAGLHISDSFVYQRKFNSIEEKREKRDFAVLYIKWCLFSILTLQVTSEGATSTGFCT